MASKSPKEAPRNPKIHPRKRTCCNDKISVQYVMVGVHYNITGNDTPQQPDENNKGQQGRVNKTLRQCELQQVRAALKTFRFWQS
jgi:hypothetical protein